MPALKTAPRITLKPQRAPSQRAYAPKATDAGQRITWTSSGDYGYARSHERSGEIWSAGPLPSSVWVQPDDAPRGAMACVMLRTMTEHTYYPASWQHDTVARCEHLRQSKGMFAEYVTRARYEYGRGNVEYVDTIAYHCDRDCLEIRHETRDCGEWEPSVGSVIRMLLDASARGRSDLCRRCVYLTDPGITEAG